MSESHPIVFADVECRFVPDDVERLQTAARLIIADDVAPTTVLQGAEQADVLVASCFARVDLEVLAAGKQLKSVVKYGVGTDNIDLAEAERRGIIVANCPDYGSGTVAEHAFALLMTLARKTSLIDRHMRAHGWMWPEGVWCGVDITGKTVGIVGLGHIGREFAKRCTGFDVQMLAHDPHAAPQVFDAFGCTAVSLATLLKQSEFVSLHCTLTQQTRGLIDAAALTQMKDSAYLINVSRGGLIDQSALVNALQRGQIAGAGLDVFAAEPLVQDDPLLQLDNVVVAPHLAWFTQEAAARQSKQAADAVLDLLAGRRPYSVVAG